MQEHTVTLLDFRLNSHGKDGGFTQSEQRIVGGLYSQMWAVL